VPIEVKEYINIEHAYANAYWFCPSHSVLYDSPWYRFHKADWGWNHGPCAWAEGTIKIGISAFDIDSGPNVTDQWDQIWVRPIGGSDGDWQSIGYLVGEDNQWSYTQFTLTATQAEWLKTTGITVWIDIDSKSQFNRWATTLAKSVVFTDGESLPVPEPTPFVPPSASPVSGVAPLSVSFLPGSVNSPAWQFGDGAKSALAAPRHTYYMPGSYRWRCEG
jgi:hypothetical protein